MALNLGELVVFLDADSTGLDRGLRHADAATGGTESRFGQFAKRGVIAMGAVGAAGTLLGIKTAAGNEQAMISFETMLGSAEAAGAFLKDLQAFAASTPFEFPELQTAASSLISAGIEADKVIPIMTTLGDVTSGMGTGSEGVQRATVALQQMSAAGRITGEDLNQLRDAGIPVYDLLASATGKSKEEVVALAQAGKLGKAELGAMMEALESGKGLEKFGGLMEAQSESLAGKWSNMLDTIGRGSANVIMPLLPLMKDGLAGASAAAAVAFVALTAGAEGLAAAITWVDQLVTNNQTTFMVLGGIIGTLLIPVLIALAVQAGISAVAMVIGWATSAASAAISIAAQLASMTLLGLGYVRIGIQATASALRMAAAWIIAMGPIGLVIAAFVGVVIAVVKNWDTIKTKTKAAWDWVVAQVKKVPGLLVGFFLNFTLPGLIIKHWDGIKRTVSAGATAVVGYVKKLPGRILSAVGNLGTLLSEAGKDVMRGLRDGIDAGFDWVRSKLEGVGKVIPGWLKKVLGISSPSKVMADQVGQWIPAGVAAGITAGIPDLKAAAQDMALATVTPFPSQQAANPLPNGFTTPAEPGYSGLGLPPIQQHIHPRPEQSEQQIGDAAARRLLFALENR